MTLPPRGAKHQTLKVKITKVFMYFLRNNLHAYLSGHLFHHILGSLCVLEGQVGLGDLEVLEDHSLLVPLSEGRHFQGGLGARELLTTRRRQKSSFSQRQI